MAAACAAGTAFLSRQRRRPPANAAYVALGSSFAAGLGLGPRVPGSPVVSRRSSNGYPPQLARLLEVPSFTDVSSSGATVRHVLHGGQVGLPAQVDALGPDTRLVTLTAGGNDIGYVGDLFRMAYGNRGGVTGRLLRPLGRRVALARNRDFASLRADMATLIQEIRRRSPRARLVVTTYPTILPVAGTCPALSLSADQVAEMRLVGNTLAEVTRDAAAGTGAILVDMAHQSEQHGACDMLPWVNGSPGRQGADFHPTPAGARAMALAIAAALRRAI